MGLPNSTAKLKPNTTQIPNVILDEWMAELTPAEFKVIMLIARQTYGWHKDTDRISYTQLIDKTGYGADTITVAVKALRASGKIIVTDSEGIQLHTVEECRGKSLYYRLNLEGTTTTRKSRVVSPNYSENPSWKSRVTKETITKTLPTVMEGVRKKPPSCPLLNGSPLKARYPGGHQECVEHYQSVQEERAEKFINSGKQFEFLHKILRAGYGFDKIDRAIAKVEHKYGRGNWDYSTIATWLEKGAAHA